jgi:hypothetical protein
MANISMDDVGDGDDSEDDDLARLASSSAHGPHVNPVYGHPCKHANRTGETSDASDAPDAPDDDAKLDEYTRNTPPFVISPSPSIRTSSARSKHSFQLLASVDKVAFAFASPASSSS